MKRIFLSLLLVLVFCFGVYGASSDDVYVRKDMFEMRMDRLEKTIDRVVNEVGELNKTVAVLAERINGLDARLSSRIDDVSGSLVDLRNNIYLWLVVLGVVFAIPSVQKFFQWREEKKEKTEYVLTVEDVRKLINEAFLANKFSVQGK